MDMKRKGYTFGAIFLLVIGVWEGYVLFHQQQSHHIAVHAQKLHSIYIAQDFPLRSAYITYFSNLHYQIATNPEDATVAITTSPHNASKTTMIVYTNIFSLVTDFKNMSPNLSSQQYQSLSPSQLAVDPSISQFFPTYQQTADPLSFVSADQNHYAIIPFDQLTNTLRTVSIDNNAPIQKSFNALSYPLKKIYYLSSTVSLSASATQWIQSHTYSNYDPKDIHTIIITGTTALGRGEYFRIKQYGVDYPALYVAPIMRNADITQVSDEVSYVPDCTQQVGTLSFCALPSFINTLKYAGVNLVELTGNHNNDWGAQYSASSISLYNQNNIQHFGGGLNDTDARKPALFTLNGTTFAFLGYNEPGPSYAFATPTSSGAAKLDVSQMVNDIAQAKKVAQVVFVDVQWQNENNQFPSQSQMDISKIAVDAGADVVTGSQAHRPQGMMFYKGKTVMFGLGNLFFDQMENLDTRQNVIVRHTFYNDKLVSTELIPTLLYDYSQPRPVSGSDAQAILNEIFQASTNVL